MRSLYLGLPLVILVGCGSSAAKVEKLVEASGKVTLDNKPTDGIRLSFQPLDGTKAVGGCWAVTDGEGNFTVTHWSKKKGIPPGKYQVLFSRRVKADGSVLGPSESPTMVQSMESISAMYSDPGKVGMHNRIEVPEKGSSNLNFKLSSQPLKKKK